MVPRRRRGGKGREGGEEAVPEETFPPSGIPSPRAEPARPSPPTPPPPLARRSGGFGGCLEGGRGGEVELEEEEGEGSPGTRDSSSRHTRQEAGCCSYVIRDAAEEEVDR